MDLVIKIFGIHTSEEHLKNCIIESASEILSISEKSIDCYVICPLTISNAITIEVDIYDQFKKSTGKVSKLESKLLNHIRECTDNEQDVKCYTQIIKHYSRCHWSPNRKK